MKPLDRLSADELLALARFIVAHEVEAGTFRWRARFTDCARRGRFAPLAREHDHGALKSLCERHGSAIVCLLRTADVLRVADSVSLARGGKALSLPMRGASTLPADPSDLSAHRSCSA